MHTVVSANGASRAVDESSLAASTSDVIKLDSSCTLAVEGSLATNSSCSNAIIEANVTNRNELFNNRFEIICVNCLCNN